MKIEQNEMHKHATHKSYTTSVLAVHNAIRTVYKLPKTFKISVRKKRFNIIASHYRPLKHFATSPIEPNNSINLRSAVTSTTCLRIIASSCVSSVAMASIAALGSNNAPDFSTVYATETVVVLGVRVMCRI